MSARLTKHERICIRDRLLEHKYKGVKEKFKNRYTDFVQEYIKDSMSPSDYRLFLSIPQEWLGQQIQWQFNIAGQWRYINTNSVFRPANRKLVIEATSPFFQKYHDLYNEEQTYTAEQSRISHEIDAMLNTYSAVAALIKGWPEVEPFVRKVGVTAPVTGLPVVQLAALNKSIGLPV
jgi:hypothetical protein